MAESTIALSLKLLMGRYVFDGGSPEAIADRLEVSVDEVHHAWFECRERLSRHFARVEEREYRVLNDNELQARVYETLKLLLEWREFELQQERLLTTTANGTDDPDIEDDGAADDKVPGSGSENG